jgi:hypothetical protein
MEIKNAAEKDDREYHEESMIRAETLNPPAKEAL